MCHEERKSNCSESSPKHTSQVKLDYSSFFSISDRSGFSMISMSSAAASDSTSLCFETGNASFSSSATIDNFGLEISMSESVVYLL